jgi:signal peptide peptidase SppA
VLPIYGVIGQRMNMLGDISGGTSTESIGAQFDAAMRDDAVSAIVLDIDSPGGTVAGIPELAAKIHAARGQGKQVIAVANSMAASAAYWIASAADSIVVTPSGEVGSIGVFRVHTDLTKALDEAGVKKTVIRAGKYKAEGLPFEPLGDEARAAMQSDVDEYYGQFIDAVAQHRGRSAAQVKAGYGEGRTLSAKRALSAGMVDQIATLDDVLSQLGAPKGARQAAKRAEHSTHALATPAGSPEATRGEAPSLVQVIPLAPAPQAKEITVSDENTAAPGAVAPVPAAPQSLARGRLPRAAAVLDEDLGRA